MAVVISGANFNQDESVKGTSINYKNNTNEADKTGGVKTFSSVIVSKGDNSTAKAKDNTYKSLLKEADSVKEQIMASASTAKNSLKALFNKMSGAEAVKIDEDGFNLTSASTDDMVNIIEKIRIELAMHSDDYVPAGISIDSSKIEQVTHSAGAANSIESKMNNSSIAVNDDNKAQIEKAADTASQLKPMSEKVKNYMVANNVPPSIKGIYHAEHSVNADVDKSAENTSIYSAEFDSLRGQIENIIKEAGLPVNDDNLNNAKAFLQEQIPVTKENLIYKNQLDNMDLSNMDSEEKKNAVLDKILSHMEVGGSAESTLLTDEVPVLEQVADVIDTLNKSDITTVESATNQNETFTIQSLKISLQISTGNTIQNAENQDGKDQRAADRAAQVQSNYAVLQEIRILMTANAGVFLAKQGTDLYSTSVYELAEELKRYEQSSSIYNESDETYASYAEVFQIRQAVYETSQAPAEVIGQIMTNLAYEDKVTIAAFAQSGSDLRQQYERAGQTYEAVGTHIRADLGDSLGKSLENSTTSILGELQLEDNQYNRDAVRILAANNIEITKDNINKVKEIHQTLNSLIDNMKPETVLKMIRDNVNPLTDDISQVNDYLMELNNNATELNSEKYSRFLYKLDNTNGISKEERRQYIGIYKMMNIFTKDAGNAIGALVKQGADITMSNLCTAYESRKAAGIDASIDKNTGMAEVMGIVNYYRSLFSTTGNKVTPHTLMSAQNKQPISQYSVEEFCQSVEDNYNPEIEAKVLDGYIDELRKNVEADSRIIRQLELASSDITINNVQAAESLIYSGKFPKINGKNAADGIEKIGHREQLEEMYDELSTESDKELAEELSADKDQTYSDINEIRMANHEIGFIKNLAIRHDYHIPVGSADGTGIIHLTIVKDDNEQGRIAIEMNSEDIGKVSLEAKVNAKESDIFIIQSGENDILSERIETMKSALTDIFDMDRVSVYGGISDKMPERFYPEAAEKTATDELYGIAEIIVKTLSGR